ncbi:TadE/TadG family type IV pilus assembly protein [Kordiimonas marina]|uniref:TadE/TadG family type IV pilus assembly protein n=1 Tax=Kordiimonas marina TaxID=2872312 RepID=UPI001FF36967|nr:TadE/TadG family type IV pilus assembly protein [Kordiimonas marina]MCJ9428596.1 pilus assembly protein [Kordiimonas marina]
MKRMAARTAASLSRVARRFRGFRRAERGVAAVEFALTLPIYLGAVIFLAEVARIAFTQGVIIHAAEEATRYALVHYNATVQDVQNEARSNLIGLDPNNLNAIVVTAPEDPTDQTKLVTVEVQYTYTPILPINLFLPGADTNGIRLTGESRGFITQEIPKT